MAKQEENVGSYWCAMGCLLWYGGWSGESLCGVLVYSGVDGGAGAAGEDRSA